MFTHDVKNMPEYNEEKLLKVFQQISAVPRSSRHEQQIAQWLQNWASERGFQSETDLKGNLVIRINATPGFEQAPTIILQGHLDMVCEKRPDSNHDFSKDPIRCIKESEWLHADGTTLGADNGIAVALAIAIAENDLIVHPPLEFLFTVEEEIGIGGAASLQNGFVKGKILVNLDSEEEGVFIIGCAGGVTSRIQLPASFTPAVSTETGISILVSGLQGGHSGAEIHKDRANANKLMAQILGEVIKKIPFRIAELRGGTAHNAITRQALATVLVEKEEVPALKKILTETIQAVMDEYLPSEESLSIQVKDADPTQAISQDDSRKTVALLQALPHGVFKMSQKIPGFVETSNNLAIIELKDSELMILSSQRSMSQFQLKEITEQIEAIASLAGAHVSTSDGYPAWIPAVNSPLLSLSSQIYERLFGTPARIATIHAGLECGQIGEIFGGLDMISLGATILGAHTPEERLNLPSLEKTWRFLVALLNAYAFEKTGEAQ